MTWPVARLTRAAVAQPHIGHAVGRGHAQRVGPQPHLMHHRGLGDVGQVDHRQPRGPVGHGRARAVTRHRPPAAGGVHLGHDLRVHPRKDVEDRHAGCAVRHHGHIAQHAHILRAAGGVRRTDDPRLHLHVVQGIRALGHLCAVQYAVAVRIGLVLRRAHDVFTRCAQPVRVQVIAQVIGHADGRDAERLAGVGGDQGDKALMPRRRR